MATVEIPTASVEQLVGARPAIAERPTPLLKRLFDITLSGLGLIVSSPLWALFAALIKLEDRGPVFYRQARVGQGGRLFEVLKFRSMIPDADAKLGSLQAREGD